jgi:LPS-assembly protein
MRQRLMPIVASLLLFPALAPATGAVQWRCGADQNGVWSCHDVGEKPSATPDAAPAATGPGTTGTGATSPGSSAAPQAPDQRPAPPTPPAGTTPQSNAGKATPVDKRWTLCPPAPAAPPAKRTETGAASLVNLYGDTAEAVDQVYTVRGNAVALYDQQRLTADTLTYNLNAGWVDAQGNLHYSGPGLLANGDHGRLFPDTKRGTLYGVDYTLPERHGRGQAEVVHMLDPQHEQLDRASYTTCAPGNADWLISARQVDIDRETGTGIAHHAWMNLRGMPVLYTPYISFPIDNQRRSGLLIPKIGVSQQTGLDLSVPYYWNIAPNYDATLEPRLMTDRGVMLATEFRYLQRHNSGMLRAEYLPSDNMYDNKSRSLVSFEDNGNPLPRLTTHIDARNVSDKDYFKDLGTTLVQSSQSFLQREAQATYHGNRWTLDTRVLNFQTVDPAIAVVDRPYMELPRVRFSATPEQRLLGMRFNVDSEVTQFEKDKAVTGTRVDLWPQLTLPFERASYYIKPSVGLRETFYELNDQQPGDPNNPRRSTAVADVDTGMFFDRGFQWRGAEYVQTLEPRLYYLYVPYRKQDDIPVFDTGDYDFSFWQLFQENRFTGPDRMGDANQLAAALTTRVLDPTSGVQRLRASLGQLVYFRNLKVTLPDEPVVNDNTSDLIGEIGMMLSREWDATTQIQWDPSATRTDRGDILLQYHPAERQLVNLSYRFRRGSQNQTDISFLWPLGNAWHLVGRWNYSLKDSKNLEMLAGFGYESCCWALQLVGRSYVNNVNGDLTNGVYLQVELKGLTSTGSQVDNLLRRDILGYESSD